jgi:predicted enzyme related to lactoylglutathione lyase
MPLIGQFSWHELATSDHEAAFAFYSNLFGWEALQRMDMGPLGTYLIFGWNGNQRGGIYNKPADMPAPPNWLPYARVPNADAAFKTAMGGGAREVNGPMDVPGGGRIAAFFDPTGAAFAVVSSTQDAADASTAKPKSAARAKPKPKAKPKSKAVAPKKKKAAKKPAAKGKVARKAAKKAAKKAAPKKKRSAAKRKVATRRKK